MDRAAGVQVCGFADGNRLTDGGCVIHRQSGGGEAAHRFAIEGNSAFTIGGGGTTTRLLFDQLADGVAARADDLGRAVQRGGERFAGLNNNAENLSEL